jgi:hypothetical protein
MQQNSEELMGTQQPSLTTVLMMGGWIVHVILGIVYGINANRGARRVGGLPPHWPMVSPQRGMLVAICLVTLVTTLRCGSRDASDTIIRLL